MATKRKHNDYSMDMKYKVLKSLQSGEKTKTQVITEYGLAKSKLFTWLKNKA